MKSYLLPSSLRVDEDQLASFLATSLQADKVPCALVPCAMRTKTSEPYLPIRVGSPNCLDDIRQSVWHRGLAVLTAQMTSVKVSSVASWQLNCPDDICQSV